MLIPAGATPGTYGVKVTNPDTKSALLPDALTITDQGSIGDYKVFLPALKR